MTQTLTLDLFTETAPACRPFRVDTDDIWRGPRIDLMARLSTADGAVERGEVDRVLSLMRTPDRYLETLWAHYCGVLLCREPSFDYHCRFSLCVEETTYRVDYYPPENGFTKTAIGYGNSFSLNFHGPKDGRLTSSGYYGPIFMGPRPSFPTPVEMAQADAEKHIREHAPKSRKGRS